MRYYWLQDRAQQQHFDFVWRPGETNFANYHSKHHSPTEHRHQRKHYLYVINEATRKLVALTKPTKQNNHHDDAAAHGGNQNFMRK